MGQVSAWDDPDWFRDEREANPPDWIDARKVPRSEVLDLFGLTEDGEATPARKAWVARELAERDHDPDATVESEWNR